MGISALVLSINVLEPSRSSTNDPNLHRRESNPRPPGSRSPFLGPLSAVYCAVGFAIRSSLSKATNMSVPTKRRRKLDLSFVVRNYVSLCELRGCSLLTFAGGRTKRRKVGALFRRGPCRQSPKNQTTTEVTCSTEFGCGRLAHRGKNIGSSNRQPKTQTRSQTGVLCEVISDVPLAGIHFKVPDGRIPCRTSDAAEARTSRRVSICYRLGWWTWGPSCSRLPP